MNCEHEAIKGLIAQDGGSSKCSKCNASFHYCSGGVIRTGGPGPLFCPFCKKNTDRAALKKERVSFVDIGHYETQGKRNEMEDVISIIRDGIFPDISSLYIGVFDGHSGKSAAEFASENLPKELLFSFGSITNQNAAIENAFMNTDDKFRRSKMDKPYLRDSGCTANVCIITSKSYICANIGDSRSVLARNREAIPLSFDHKPHLPIETKRIESAGMYVSKDYWPSMISGEEERLVSRVNGNLAVSRAFGDFEFKTSGKAAKDHAVTAFPDIIEIERNKRDNFIISACDGLWDVLTNDEAINYVYRLIEQDITASASAEKLVKLALSNGSTDNISCVVTYLSLF